MRPSSRTRKWARFAAVAAVLTVVCAAVAPATRHVPRRILAQDTRPPATEGCLACHAGIESMHPEAQLACVDCHGGDASAKIKAAAHVAPTRREPPDERVPPLDEDLAWRRFRNPMDLRVADVVCGRCHGEMVEHLKASLHGTTAGHLSDGYYEMGLAPKRGSTFAVFPTSAPKGHASAFESFRQVPPFREKTSDADLAAHFTDLTRKECLQCHLWSQGRAVRGRVGFDGDYRGEGCAACHVEYALDGLSTSSDKSAQRTEPGHPKVHAMQRSPSTQTCTSCHYGDAAIGLNYRGLAQLPPGAPGGPEIAGTTSELLNRQYYLKDPGLNPPDVHHEQGMHCIDCHTTSDVMGDGQLHGNMEHQVEIECSDCHGTFTAESRLVTSRGHRIPNLRREGERVILTSKVTGAEHPVVQVAHVLDPGRREYNPRAAKAMTAAHGEVECHACHAAWNPNFLGFHFDRNESLSQLDLLTGRRTPGRVTTQEKVFATFKSFYAGRDERGRISPYLTGFSTMGSVTGESGERVLDQRLPVTAAGLSGMTMIHHQMHTTRKTARSCVECHRTSTTWGLGSTNFQLARQLAFVADRRGIEVVALNRAQLGTSVPLAKLVLPDVTALEIQADPLQGFAQHLFAAEGARGIHVVDVRDPTAPKRVAFVESVQPQGLALRGDWLYVADGPGGLRIYDASEPTRLELVGSVPMCDARAVSVQWPYAYVADGPGGLAVVDVRAPIAPRVVGGHLLPDVDGGPGQAIAVQTIFQYSRPRTRKSRESGERVIDERTRARLVCAVLDEQRGLVLVDVTEPSRPRQLSPEVPRSTRERPARAGRTWSGLALASHVDLAQQQGGSRTTERDYAYVLNEVENGNNRTSTIDVIDISDPVRPRKVADSNAGQSTEGLALASFYNAPFLQTILFTCGEDGVFATDATISSGPNQLGALQAMKESYVVAVESFPLDRMLDERGRPLKDVSHEGSRWLYLSEIERILSVSAEALGLAEPGAKAYPLGVARLAFARADVDRSGWLEAGEIQGASAEADADSDGRVDFHEYARWTHAVPTRVEGTAVAPAVFPFSAGRIDPDGDLARLLDGVDPHAFDRDEDARLDRVETTAAFFAALDLDLDRGLSFAELSRHPGELRRLRYGDGAARKRFERVDLSKDGRVGPGEFVLADAEWSALDANRDGFVQLDVPRGSRAARVGRAYAGIEWPRRWAFRMLLPPDATTERVLARFDQDGDKILSRRELEKRPDLLLDMDDGANGQVEFAELKLRCDVLIGAGVEIVREGFLERWDLDGDGRVSAAEIPLVPWMRDRVRVASR